jgi:hypothetical protein
MLCDYAHEWRFRPVGLWRCVGPLPQVRCSRTARVRRGTADEQQAAALALREATEPEAARLLALHAPVTRDSRDASLAWERLTAAGS